MDAKHYAFVSHHRAREQEAASRAIPAYAREKFPLPPPYEWFHVMGYAQKASLHTVDGAVSSDIRHQVLRLLGYILSRPVADHENPSRSSEPAWDSLKHIELMFLLEDHFGLRFSEQEMSTMQDAAGIARILERGMENKGAA